MSTRFRRVPRGLASRGSDWLLQASAKRAAPLLTRYMPTPSSIETSRIRALIVGDSHVDAIKRALKRSRGTEAQALQVVRLQKLKNGTVIGDLDLDEVVARVSTMQPDDVVACFIGGNQFNAFGLVQHPRKFDFHSRERPDLAPLPGHEIVPYQALRDVFSSGLRGNDGKRICRITAASRARVYQVAPPPPKLNEARILQRHETLFREKGLLEHGITPAQIRLKLWALQVSVLGELCREWGCSMLPAPEQAIDAQGFLKDEYAGDDATHGNESYGRLNIEQVMSCAAIGRGQQEVQA